MDSSVIINQIRNVASINEMNAADLYSTSITTYMKNEIVYEIHDSEEYLSCLNNDDEISKMQQHSVPDSTEIKYFSNVLGNELTVFEATDDESMAVEALRQLGSMYSSNAGPSAERNAKIYDTKFSKTVDKEPPPFDTEPEYNGHATCHQKFVCKFCAQSFIALTELRTHITDNHPGDRPYRCHVCLQHFPRPSSLTNHLKIHNYQPGRALLAAGSKSAVPKQQVSRSSSNNATPPVVVKQQVTSGTSSVLKYENTIDTIQSSWPVEQVYLPEATVTSTAVTDTDPLATSCWQFTASSYESTGDGGAIVVSGGELTTQDNQNTIDGGDPSGPGVKVELVLPFDNKHAAFPIACVPQMEITVNSDVEMKPYTCSECGVAFARERALVAHRKVHTAVCDVLRQEHGHTCTTAAAAAAPADDPSHLASRDTTDDGQPCRKSVMKLKHACPDCAKRFATKQKMYRHMWIHRKKSYACEHCARTFQLQPDLDKHRLAVHPAHSAYVCQACGKSFASRQGLWEHGRLHGGGPAGTFTCAKCQKSFASRQGYLIHNRIHTGERPYGCRYCLKAFRDGGTLRKHERIHTGERPHVCPICRHDFNQKVVLREHVRWVHAAASATARNGPASFICQLCDIAVGDREELCAHIVRHSDQSRQNSSSTASAPAQQATISHHRNNKKQKVNVVTMCDQQQQQQVSNECDLCGNKFASHEDLMTHVHIHI